MVAALLPPTAFDWKVDAIAVSPSGVSDAERAIGVGFTRFFCIGR
jgi:hypothetical protein